MKRAILMLAALALLGVVGSAKAEIISLHQGTTDPTTEAFTGISFSNASTTGPLANDLGLPAQFIQGSAQSSQFAWGSPTLTAAQQLEIASTGFELTLVARVLQNGLALAYDSTNHVTIGGGFVNYGGKRWELELGLNGDGDTVVVLGTELDNNGPGNSVRSLGPTFTLTESGSSYHTYQLFFDPSTMLANLSVDGTPRLSNYGGDTSFVNSNALLWSAFSGGQGNFNFVELRTGSPAAAVVPEPSSLTLLGLGFLVSLTGYFWRRRRTLLRIAA